MKARTLRSSTGTPEKLEYAPASHSWHASEPDAPVTHTQPLSPSPRSVLYTRDVPGADENDPARQALQTDEPIAPAEQGQRANTQESSASN